MRLSAGLKDDTKREADTAMTGSLKDQTVLVAGRGKAGQRMRSDGGDPLT